MDDLALSSLLAFVAMRQGSSRARSTRHQLTINDRRSVVESLILRKNENSVQSPFDGVCTPRSERGKDLRRKQKKSVVLENCYSQSCTSSSASTLGYMPYIALQGHLVTMSLIPRHNVVRSTTDNLARHAVIQRGGIVVVVL